MQAPRSSVRAFRARAAAGARRGALLPILPILPILVAAACAGRTTPIVSAGTLAEPAAAPPVASAQPMAPSPRPAPAPAGMYLWTMHDRDQYQGIVGDAVGEVTGTLHVIARADGWDAVLTSSIGPQFYAKAVTVLDEQLLVVADTPYGELRFELALRGDSIPASWSVTGGVVGRIAGTLGVEARR